MGFVPIPVLVHMSRAGISPRPEKSLGPSDSHPTGSMVSECESPALLNDLSLNNESLHFRHGVFVSFADPRLISSVYKPDRLAESTSRQEKRHLKPMPLISISSC